MRSKPRLADGEDLRHTCNLLNESFDVSLPNRAATARRRRAGAEPEAPGGQGQSKGELEALQQGHRLFLARRSVVVRAYGGVEWLRLLSLTRPVVDFVAAQLEAGREPTYEAALVVIAANIDGLLPVVAQATDLEPTDLEALDPSDLELLLMTWWGCNGRFFIERALNRVAVARAQQRLGKAS